MTKRDKIIAVIILVLIISSLSFLFLYLNANDKINTIKKELIWDLGKALKQGSLDIGAVALFLREYCLTPYNGNVTMFEIIYPEIYATTLGTLTRSVDDMTWAAIIAMHLRDLGVKDMEKLITAINNVQERLIRISNLLAGKKLSPSDVAKIVETLDKISDVLSQLVDPVSSGQVPSDLVNQLNDLAAGLYKLDEQGAVTVSALHRILQVV